MEAAVEPVIIPRTESGPSAWNSVLAAGLAIVIFAAVMAFGAMQPLPILAFEVASGLLFLATWTRMIARADFTPLRSPLIMPIALFAAVVGLQVFIGTSAYAGASRTEALRYLAYFCLFVTASDIFRDKVASKRFLSAIVVFGTIVAVEAIVQDLSAPGLIYWRIPVPESGTIFGPFASHGLYAGFMELVAGVAIMKWLTLPTTDSRWLLWAFCAVTTSSSIVLSRSRAGMLALTCQLVFAAFLLARRSGKNAKPLIAMLAILIVGFSAWIGSSAVLHRATSFFDVLNKDVNGQRLTIAADGLRMFKDKPLLGWGLDVFPYAYPRYRSFATDTFINEAHNDYVQVLVETGIFGAAAVALFIVLLYRAGMKRLYSRRRDSLNWVVAGALVGCTGMFVHNIFDFNFHVTVDAALFYVLAAIVAMPGRSSLRANKSPRAHVLDLTTNGE